MEAVSNALYDRQVATLRYQFPYMEQGSKRPDSPAVAHATVRAAVTQAARMLPGLPLIAGGKSFGGRMTSQAQAAAPLPGVRGLAFLGFPLHLPKKPSTTRAQHLFAVDVPMLFLQGSRDAMADMSLLAPLIGDLRGKATLVELREADHSFHVPARSGVTDEEVLAMALDALASWIAARTAGSE
jgi:predicted alpha/beta-hydrolase family hydrolase